MFSLKPINDKGSSVALKERARKVFEKNLSQTIQSYLEMGQWLDLLKQRLDPEDFRQFVAEFHMSRA